MARLKQSASMRIRTGFPVFKQRISNAFKRMAVRVAKI